MKKQLLLFACLLVSVVASAQIPAKYIGTWNIANSKNSDGVYKTVTFYDNSIEYGYSTGKRKFNITYDAVTGVVSYDRMYSCSVFDSFTIVDITDKPVMQIKLDEIKQLNDNFDWSDACFSPGITLEKVK
ncbi:MAG: hypothetical protein M0D57_18900 [Sphingobacteriales bacterium JAD_PAG50586_3]|nr:MAG: hypothetical protein M0D57_18900 [Sphingobacteriales bacterium JAD_PAG50586_3]